MGSLEFMNQDGEWEKFPTEADIAFMKELIKEPVLPKNPHIRTICHLCNEPCPMEDIVVTGGSLAFGYTWSCPKCHAITSTGKA